MMPDEKALLEAYYRKGYREGYTEGYSDGRNHEQCKEGPSFADEEVLMLPVQSLNISQRARNCLIRAGCKYIGNVVALEDEQIRYMPLLGKKSADEIARALCEQGVFNSAWDSWRIL